MGEENSRTQREESFSTLGMRADKKRKTNEVNKRVRERIEY